MFQNIPDLVGVDFKIVVNEYVPHAGGLRPNWVRMQLAKLFGQAASRFPYNLEMVQDPDLKQLVRIELRSALGRLAENPIDGP